MGNPAARSYEDLCREQRERDAAAQSEDLPLMAGAATWPERAPVPAAEQRGLALPDTPEALYAKWRATPESDAMIHTMRIIAGEWAKQGATAIGPRTLWEAARLKLKKSVDNRLQALACREVEDSMPTLRGMFRHRMRKAG